MSIALPTLIFIIFIIPGYVFSRTFLNFDGNRTTDSIWSVFMVVALVVSILINLTLIELINAIDSLRNVSLGNLMNLINNKEAEVVRKIYENNLPTIPEFLSYIVTATLLGYLLGYMFEKLRLNLLTYSITHNLQWAYSLLRHGQDWFNYFSGFTSPSPVYYIGIGEEVAPNRKLYGRLSQRLVLLLVTVKVNENETNEIYGFYRDFTIKNKNELLSLTIQTIDSDSNSDSDANSELLEGNQYITILGDNIIYIEPKYVDILIKD